MLDLADKHGLAIVLTLADYTDWDLARVAKLDGAIAARYVAEPRSSRIDLKNEPHFGDLALADLPPGETPPLQDPALVASIGERITREEIPEYRASENGQKTSRRVDRRAGVRLRQRPAGVSAVARTIRRPG